MVIKALGYFLLFLLTLAETWICVSILQYIGNCILFITITIWLTCSGSTTCTHSGAAAMLACAGSGVTAWARPRQIMALANPQANAAERLILHRLLDMLEAIAIIWLTR